MLVYKLKSGVSEQELVKNGFTIKDNERFGKVAVRPDSLDSKSIYIVLEEGKKETGFVFFRFGHLGDETYEYLIEDILDILEIGEYEK